MLLFNEWVPLNTRKREDVPEPTSRFINTFWMEVLAVSPFQRLGLVRLRLRGREGRLLRDCPNSIRNKDDLQRMWKSELECWLSFYASTPMQFSVQRDMVIGPKKSLIMLSNVWYTIKNHLGQDGRVFSPGSSLDGALKGGNAPFHNYLAILNEEYFSDRKSKSWLSSFE